MFANVKISAVARRLVVMSAFGLVGMLLSASPVAAQPPSPFFNPSAEFGPSPDAAWQAPAAAPFPSDRTPRSFDQGRANARSRDPSSLKERLRPFLGADEDDFGPALPADFKPTLEPIPFDNRVVPTNRTDEWQPRRNPPTTPAVKPQPSVAEKIAKRYADPRVVRIVQQLTPSAGEALYLEVSQMIDNRHVQPTTYHQRVQSALEHLTIALQTPSFQQATRSPLTPAATHALQQDLRDYANRIRVSNRPQSVEVLRTTGQIVADAGVNPAVVPMEFVYGALDTLDQYSMLIAPEKSGNSSLGLNGSMVGIGVELESHPEGMKILKVLPGGPAAEVTLRRGDIITAVDGKQIAGLELNRAADLISGPAGTEVKIDLKRDALIGDVTLTRRSFKVNSVSEVRMEANGVGYIKLDQFGETSAQEMDDALWKLHNEGMRSLVFDLRGNPGGLLTTAISLSDRFLPGGTIVSTKGRTDMDNSEEVAQYNNTWKIPLVVLVDHDSASASEIFAAAIQDHQRGVIVGEKSYGKGTVQTLFPMQSVPSALRLTTAKFYSPEGREMAGAGVTPDISVTSQNRTADRDPALQAAIKAAQDPNVINMATRNGRRDRSAMRMLKVAI